MQSDVIQEFLNDLRKTTSGDVRTDPYSLTLYSTDASIYQVKPYGVLIPRSLEDIQAAVQAAARYKVPILPRAAGSSLAGQAVNEAVVIDVTRHLDQVLEINTEEKWVKAQPGLVLDELNLQLRAKGLQFGPDPASSNRAGLSGIVANNSTGSHSILYGMAADHVLETGVILSDGTVAKFGPLNADQLTQHLRKGGLEGNIYRRIYEISQDRADTIRAATPRHWRRCGGYNLDRFVDGVSYQYPQDPRFNLAKLICGSEGTLGVITELKLNLVPLPKRTALVILHFDTLVEALKAVPAILQVEPSAIELLDNLSISLCRKAPEYARLLSSFVEGEPNCVLITEFYGETEAELEAKIERLRTHLKREQIGITDIVPAIAPALQANVWAVRKAGLGLLMSMKGDFKPIPFIEDSAVPVEHLADYVTRIERFCNDLGTRAAYYAHASGGCLHIRPLINAKVASEVAKLPQISNFAAELLGELGGTWSSEHGDGRSRSWLNESFFGRELYALYCDVKQCFDPNNILNPGNVVNGPSMTEKLRFGAGYDVLPIKEHLDFSEDQGFHRAVEMCNGAGVCRKRTDGTMCPSFMVTREEEHSTRGRANALRAALSGQLPAEEFTSPQMYEVMDLCIECKACQSECPSAVDMAKVKFEFLSHYYDRHGIPLRAKLFADIAFWSHLSSGLPAQAANWALKNRLIRWGLERHIGISRARQLPPFAAQPFTHWFKFRPQAGRPDRARSGGTSQAKKVVLFNDTFNTYNYPQTAIAATEFLEAAGFEVVLPGHKCCGRPMISKGLINKARRAAKDTVNRLLPLAEQGLPIVGLEPSCILSMRDEYFSLLPHQRADVQLVSDYCYTFEEFIAKLADDGELGLKFKAEPKEILLHGHCQQKALVGTGPSKRVLEMPTGYRVTEVDSGCCGMAGAFGYETEHYDISLAMAERRLLPEIRRQTLDTIIAAPGVSCRQQIKHGSGRLALHPAEILRAAMA
jgi:FAD/FMN-containing dehydrogenase/Fe-S oxidoreductase